MSIKQIVELVDDTDGTPAMETIRFSLDHDDYEIDLSDNNAKALRKGLREFIEKARKIPTIKTQTPRTRARRIKTADVRAWAKLRGITLQERGRIPLEIMAQYEASQRAVTPTEQANVALATEPATAPETAPQSPSEPLDDPAAGWDDPLPETEPPAPTVRTMAPDETERKVIRAWAKKRKIKINDRGKIPTAIIAKYDADNPAKTET